MQQAAIVAYWSTMALYAGAVVLYAYFFMTKRQSFSRYATVLTAVGVLTHTASIGLRSTATSGTQLTGPNTLVLMAWALVLVYFVAEYLVKLKVYGTVLIPIALVMMLVAEFMGVTSEARGLGAEQLRQLDSWRVGIHVALIVFANAGFAVGAAASAAYLALEGQLKRHKTSTLFKRLPSLGQADAVARTAIASAFPAYTAGLLLGVLRAVETDVSGWWADPRVMLAGIVWFTFGAYLYLRWQREASGRTSAWIGAAGFIVVVALAVVARTVPAGFHVFGL